MFSSVEHSNHPHPDALVHFLFTDKDAPLSLSDEARSASSRPEFNSKPGQIAQVFPSSGPREIIVGLGDSSKLSVEAVRKAAIKLAQHIDNCQLEVIHIAENSTLNELKFGQAIGVGFQLASYNPRQMPGSRTEQEREVSLQIKALSEQFDKGLARGVGLGNAVNFSRRLVNTPPNIANPLWMADQAHDLSTRCQGLSVRVIQGQELDEESLIGHINVGRASCNPPCMIRIEWNPDPSANQKPVVLVGKTITYDTGGLSIKSKTGMPGMKHDKAGGCVVLGVMQAVADVIKPNFPVVALLTAAENSIDATAYRPDDVITYRNGVTVEVTNTDAEGRLVLADGLCWACEIENPECVIDIATLTGGVVTALGAEFAGLFTENERLLTEIKAAGDLSGEDVWQLPLTDGFRDMMKGSVSDIVNSVPGGKGHASQGAAFLSCFVTPEVPFAHIDMAGLSHTRNDEFPVDGPSGWGVRLLAQFLTARSENN
jgi:leucyl aminopeptidase